MEKIVDMKLMRKIVITLILILSACAPHKIDIAGLDVYIKAVPFFPQEDNQCGPSSLAMVIDYWGGRVSPDDIAKEIFSKGAAGTLNLDMLIYPRERGFDARQLDGTLDLLKDMLSKGYPVIVLVDCGIAFYQIDHYMVVIGYGKGGIIAHSGREADKFIPYDEFMRIWKRGDYWMLLIKPKGQEVDKRDGR